MESDEEEQRITIRKELSEMSFEQLLTLKEKIGVKLLNETLLGTRPKIVKNEKEFKRENKNRPREMSSKRPHRPSKSKTAVSLQRFEARDPRFDPLCGSFDKEKFEKRYSFVDKIKEDECAMLKKELKQTKDPERARKIRLLLQRFENQKREKERLEKKREELQKEKYENIDRLKHGVKPVYKRKSEKKMEKIVQQYEELQRDKRVHGNIEKTRRKQDKATKSKHIRYFD